MRSYRTEDDVTAFRIEDGNQVNLHLKDLGLFASGAFSNVYKGVAETPSNHSFDVVVKKTWPRSRNSPIEVKILRKLNRLKHKNIIRLVYSYQKDYEGKFCLSLIFEYMPLNLYQYLKLHNRRIDLLEIKLIAWQLFRAQFHLQRMDICHRDVKPQNLLYDADSGLLKVSDFGSSAIDPHKVSQPSYHVTRYYRPPELLLGSKKYGCEVDIWSCGCVFGELLKGGVFLPGRNTNNQAEIIFSAIGTPTTAELNAMNASKTKFKEIMENYEPAEGVTPNFRYLIDQQYGAHRTSMTYVHNTLIDRKEMEDSIRILRKVLVYSPENRMNGTELLLNPYFKSIFSSQALRFNGKRIGCLTIKDLETVRIGDKTVTGTADSSEESKADQN